MNDAITSDGGMRRRISVGWIAAIAVAALMAGGLLIWWSVGSAAQPGHTVVLEAEAPDGEKMDITYTVDAGEIVKVSEGDTFSVELSGVTSDVQYFVTVQTPTTGEDDEVTCRVRIDGKLVVENTGDMYFVDCRVIMPRDDK